MQYKQYGRNVTDEKLVPMLTTLALISFVCI